MLKFCWEMDIFVALWPGNLSTFPYIARIFPYNFKEFWLVDFSNLWNSEKTEKLVMLATE